MTWLAAALRQNPDLAVFLTLGIGSWLGNVKFGSFSLGSATGALLAGAVIGQLDISVPSTTKQVLFLLFLFANGYAVGPHFQKGLERDGVKPLCLTLVQACIGLADCVVFAKLLRLDLGLAGGLLSGALTQSPAIGTASDAITRLGLPEEETKRLVSHVAVADALTYIFGTVGAVWFLSRGAPALLGIDLAAEAKKLEGELGIRSERPEILSAYRPFAVRAYRVEAPDVAGKTVREIEQAISEARVFVLRLRHGPEIRAVSDDTRVDAGDVVVIAGRREAALEAGARLGPEAVDSELLDFPVTAATVLITSREIAGRTIGELAARHDARGVYARRLTRLGQEIPMLPGTRIESGDVIELVGAEPEVARVSTVLGRAVRPTLATDLTTMALAVVIGGLIGTLYVMLGGIRLGLGVSIGALIAGVVVGHFAFQRPGFGYVPEAAIELMRNLGLAAFVGIAGIQAGPHFVDALRQSGISLLLAGVVCTLLPLSAGVLFGRYVLGMNPVLLLAGCAGAQTMTPALAAVQEAAQSKVPVLGYTVPYATGQVLLTFWGSLIITILA
jgi:putative transport protein